MELFESVMFFSFLANYTGGAARAFICPEKERISEVRFFSSSQLHFSDAVMFSLAAVAAVAMVAHIWLEGFVWSQSVLYGNLSLFIFFALAHLTNTFRHRRLERARAATLSSYKAAGLRRFAVIVLMVALPLTLPR